MEKEEIRIKQRYKIEKVLGQGGFGVTYLAYDEELCQEVVLKKYRWEHGSLDNEVINKRDYYKKQRKAFLNEARILSSLFDIKEVVKVLDYFEERENAYIVMEFVQGISLRQYLESRNQPMSFTEAWNFLLPVMEALEKVHQNKLIHRDISPDNFIIKEDGSIKLLDFGSAREYAEEKTMTVLVKKGYAPPEQYSRKGKQGPWTDIYSICATLYEMITGVIPQPAMERLKADKLYLPSSYGCDITPLQEKILMKGLALDYPITCNSLCLEEMRKVVSKAKCPGLIRFPEEKKAVKSVLSSLEEELKKEEGNSRTRFLIIKGYPDYYDSESREILQRLCASANIYHLIVLIMKTKQEDERRNIFENQLIKQSVRVSTQNGKFIQISKDGTRQRPFFWYSSIKEISDEELKKIQKDYVPKEKGTRYLERINPEFPPKYQCGNRRIKWPFGIDSSGKVYEQDMEGTHFAAFLMGGSGSGKSTLLENLINNLVMSYHPDDVELWIMDLKGTAQITNIIEHCPPHIKYLLVPKGETMIFAFLDRIEKEYKRRIDFLNNVGRPEKYRNYGKWDRGLDVPKEVYGKCDKRRL